MIDVAPDRKCHRRVKCVVYTKRKNATACRRIECMGTDNPEVQRLLTIRELSQGRPLEMVEPQSFREITFRVGAHFHHDNFLNSLRSVFLQLAHGFRPTTAELLDQSDFNISYRQKRP